MDSLNRTLVLLNSLACQDRYQIISPPLRFDKKRNLFKFLCSFCNTNAMLDLCEG